MKLTKLSKKIIAIVSAFAMVIASIVYAPTSVEAIDWSDTTDWNTQTIGEVTYKLQHDGNWIVGFNHFGKGYMTVDSLWCNFTDAAYDKVVINGTTYNASEYTEASDTVRFMGAQIWFSEAVVNKEQNVLTFYNGSTVRDTVYVYNPSGTPGGGESESQTQAESESQSESQGGQKPDAPNLAPFRPSPDALPYYFAWEAIPANVDSFNVRVYLNDNLVKTVGTVAAAYGLDNDIVSELEENGGTIIVSITCVADGIESDPKNSEPVVYQKKEIEPIEDGKELITERTDSGVINAPAVTEPGEGGSGAYNGTEFKHEGLSIKAGTFYKAECTVDTSIARTIQFRFQRSGSWDNFNSEGFKNYSVEEGKTNIVYIFEATQNSETGVFDICYGYIDAPVEASTIRFTNVSLKEYTTRDKAEEDSVEFEVSDYKGASATEQYPTRYGKIFAGWYSDTEFTTPYSETSGKAYAKFIDKNVLAGAYQLNNENAPTAIRFVSTIDCKDYQEIGFFLSGTYGESQINDVKKTVKNIYKSVIAGGDTITPTSQPFSDESKWLYTYTLRNIDIGKTLTMEYTPYFITADGTTVRGATCHYPSKN